MEQRLLLHCLKNNIGIEHFWISPELSVVELEQFFGEPDHFWDLPDHFSGKPDHFWGLPDQFFSEPNQFEDPSESFMKLYGLTYI
ncbi:hypothetical protein ACQKMI_17080 [Lysinibacillus sp. NPDC097214]|uniref:hypothetical protein n=1 Tax=Lysinibacillus sp. NPDC097214 TaxID=3390584 RepID=UPI003D043383